MANMRIQKETSALSVQHSTKHGNRQHLLYWNMLMRVDSLGHYFAL